MKQTPELPRAVSIFVCISEELDFRHFLPRETALHYENTCLFKYTEHFTTKKNENVQIKNSNIFHVSAQYRDYKYSLELPHRGGSNEYYNLCFEQK